MDNYYLDDWQSKVDKQAIKVIKRLYVLNNKYQKGKAKSNALSAPEIKKIGEYSNNDLYDRAITILRNAEYIKPECEIQKDINDNDIPWETGKFMIDELGITFIENNNHEKFRFWFPIIISFVLSFTAIIISIISLIQSSK